MITYLTTQQATIEAAEQAKKENFETYILKSNFFCPCGESFACHLTDAKTLNTLQIFVNCEVCHNLS